MNNQKKLSVAECLRVGFVGILDNFGSFFLATCTFILSAAALVILLFLLSALIFPSVEHKVSRSYKKGEIIETISTTESSEEKENTQQTVKKKSHDFSTKKTWLPSCTDSLNCITQITLSSTKATLALFIYALEQGSFIFFILFLIVSLAFIGLWLGYIKFVLEIHDKNQSSVKVIFSQFRKSFTSLLATILYFLMVGLGLMCFVVPGIVVAIRFRFYQEFIVDKNAGVLESLSRSLEATRNHNWSLFALAIIESAIMTISAPLYLITRNATLLANIHAYRFLSPQE